MAYVTTSDLTTRIHEASIVDLTDDEKLATSESLTLAQAITANPAIEVRINAAIDDADAIINTYLHKIYDPDRLAASPPQSVKSISCAMAIFNLHARRANEFEMPTAIGAARDAALAALVEMAKSSRELGANVAADSSVVARVVGDAPLFTAQTLSRF